MSVETLYDPEKDQACFFCNTSDWAFGPIFNGCKKDAYSVDLSPMEEADLFLASMSVDPRTLPSGELESAYCKFLKNLKKETSRDTIRA